VGLHHRDRYSPLEWSGFSLARSRIRAGLTRRRGDCLGAVWVFRCCAPSALSESVRQCGISGRSARHRPTAILSIDVVVAQAKAV
jgi:hypothetical protein